MVHKKWLIITNALVWAAAGINIARIGITAAIEDGTCVWLWSIVVFILFSLMFLRVIGKNAQRINAMEHPKAPLYKFLTVKGYLIIAFMMTLGIVLRHLSSIPTSFFAYFYTGLGLALCLAGISSFWKIKR